MKAVVGVGHMKQCLIGAHVFARLGFPIPSAVLVHVVEPVLPDGGFLPDTSTSPIASIQNERRAAGEERMAEVATELERIGIPCESVIRFGNPAREIVDVANETKADVVVAGSSKKGKLETFVMGSVARALVGASTQSILIGKSEISESPKIDVVFATDHSEYANKCLDHLVALNPTGIGKATVLSADTSEKSVADAFRAENPEGLTTEDLIARKNEKVATKLKTVADSVESVVLRGRANDVITAAMEQTKADLLVLGAHGKGFIERVFMGSTAVYMVGNSPWNVLVLRV